MYIIKYEIEFSCNLINPGSCGISSSVSFTLSFLFGPILNRIWGPPLCVWTLILGLFEHRSNPRPCPAHSAFSVSHPFTFIVLLCWSIWCYFSLIYICIFCAWETGLLSSFIKGYMLRVRPLAAGYNEVGWKVGCRQQPFGDWPFSRQQYWCDLDGTWEDCPLGSGHILFCNDLGCKRSSFIALNVGHVFSAGFLELWLWMKLILVWGKVASVGPTLITLVSCRKQS